jgi:hypothetical protein
VAMMLGSMMVWTVLIMAFVCASDFVGIDFHQEHHHTRHFRNFQAAGPGTGQVYDPVSVCSYVLAVVADAAVAAFASSSHPNTPHHCYRRQNSSPR